MQDFEKKKRGKILKSTDLVQASPVYLSIKQDPEKLCDEPEKYSGNCIASPALGLLPSANFPWDWTTSKEEELDRSMGEAVGVDLLLSILPDS